MERVRERLRKTEKDRVRKTRQVMKCGRGWRVADSEREREVAVFLLFCSC